MIIGAGPAGLTAAWRLLRDAKEHYHPIIIESADLVGGIACTVNYKGNRMDMGGHRFFTKSQEVEDAWFGLEPNNFEKRTRVSRIFFQNKFYDYPVSLTLRTIANLGFLQTFSAGFSYLKAAIKKRPEHSLEDFYINRFGKVLYGLFFERYTEKLWGVHPRDLSPEWGAQRVKGLSLTRVVLDFLTKPFRKKGSKNVETSLIDWFWYPLFGPGQYWEQMAESVVASGGEIRMNSEVVGLETTRKGGVLQITAVQVRDTITKEQYRLEADAFISSMPIKDLVVALGDVVPKPVREIAVGLPYRDFMMVGLLVDRLTLDSGQDGLVPDCWIYIQDPDVKLGRIQIYNNWSTDMVAASADTVWLGLEYVCLEGDELWSSRDEDLIAFATSELVDMGVIAQGAVQDGTVVRVKKAYPAYFGAYEHFDEVREFLLTIDNLYCVGRNGQHRYNNMDHSMLTSFEAIRALLDPNYDRRALWNVNAEQEYIEGL